MDELSYRVVTTDEALLAAVGHLSQCEVIGFDTETTSLSPWEGRMRLLQLAAPDVVYVFDLDRFADGDAGKVEALAPLRRLLAAPRPVKVAHNAKFDVKWVNHYLGAEVGGVFDSLLASQLISAGEQEDRHNLEAVAGRFLGEALDKSEQLSNWGGELSESQLRYAARDAAIMLPLREKMITRLRADELVRCAQLEFECVAPVADLELAGIFLDRERWREVLGQVEKKRATLAEELQEMLAEGTAQGSLFANARADINLDSHTQLTAALKRLGVPVPDSTRNWKLQPLAKDYPVVAKLLEYRTVQKALTSYGANILEEINPKTGRIHADFHQIGAPTGRFSCTRPNIQQVPHSIEYRRCFRAPEDRKLVISDYCVVKGTRVAVRRGLVPIEDVRVGDSVYLEDGSTANVSAKINRGVLPVITVTLRNGYSLTATTLHRIRVLNAAGDYVWRRIGELQETDFVAVQPERGLNESLPDVELPEAINTHFRNNLNLKTPSHANENVATFLGYLAGDGYFGRNVTCWVVNEKDRDVSEQLRAQAAELFGIEVHDRGTYRGVIETCLYSIPLAVWCGRIGAAKDQVPAFLWLSRPSVVAAYLRGLFEADGSVTDSETGKVSFASSRRRLAAEVHQLLLALGIPATLREQRGTGPGKKFKCWVVSVLAVGLNRFRQRIGFMSGRKKAKLELLVKRWTGKTVAGNMPNLQHKVRALNLSGEVRRLTNNTASLGRSISTTLALTLEKNYPLVAADLNLSRITCCNQLFLPVISIEPAGEQEVFDLSVPGPMTYISDGFVSHNSQIELRILAQFTGDQGFIDAFQTGADLHRVTAAQVFNVAPEEVTSEQRSFAKRLNFGVVYGIGAQRFSMMTGLSLTEAEDILRRYFATYRALDMWLRDAARQAVRERTAPRTVAGRLARFNFDATDRQAMSLVQRNGKNSPIQGSSADILKRAMRLLYDKLRGTTARVVNIVHDEVVVEADADQAAEVAKTVEDAMCAAGEEYVKAVPIKVESEIADDWVKN